jgi:hypothetical protein
MSESHVGVGGLADERLLQPVFVLSQLMILSLDARGNPKRALHDLACWS